MTNSVTLATKEDGADLKTYLERAERLGCEHVWLVGAGNALAAYVAVLTPQGLLDIAPTVLGLRVFEKTETDSVDVVVQVRALLDRLAHDRQHIALPVGQAGIAWSGVAPPRSGWEVSGDVSEKLLLETAEAGIAEVAQANGLGTQIVQKVREEVWKRPCGGQGFPAGVAFAGFGLGFWSDEFSTVSHSGSWTKVTSTRGHVLVK